MMTRLILSEQPGQDLLTQWSTRDMIGRHIHLEVKYKLTEISALSASAEELSCDSFLDKPLTRPVSCWHIDVAQYASMRGCSACLRTLRSDHNGNVSDTGNSASGYRSTYLDKRARKWIAVEGLRKMPCSSKERRKPSVSATSSSKYRNRAEGSLFMIDPRITGIIVRTPRIPKARLVESEEDMSGTLKWATQA